MRLGRHKLTSSKGLLDPPSLGVGITIGSDGSVSRKTMVKMAAKPLKISNALRTTRSTSLRPRYWAWFDPRFNGRRHRRGRWRCQRREHRATLRCQNATGKRDVLYMIQFAFATLEIFCFDLIRAP